MVAVRNSRIAMVAIFVNNLIKTFGDKTAVSIPEFCFPSNEIIGLVGQTISVKTNLALVGQGSLILKSHGRTMSLPISMRVSLLISLRQESASPLLVKLITSWKKD